MRGLRCDAYVTQDGPELLCEAHEVENTGTLAFEVRSHRNQRANRNDAGAADTGNEQVVAGPEFR